ncbi:MAG: hypothetical protein P8X70_00875 [Nanoarchaeota archaeon]
MESWLFIKVFPKCYGSNDPTAVPKIWELGKRFLPILKNLDTISESYHFYYSNDVDYPEGPHLKFCVKTKKKKPFFDWKNKVEKYDYISKINIEEVLGNESEENEECLNAGKIFWKYKDQVNKNNLKKLVFSLKKDAKFNEILEKAKKGNKASQTAIHFLCGMFQMLPMDEKAFVLSVQELN